MQLINIIIIIINSQLICLFINLIQKSRSNVANRYDTDSTSNTRKDERRDASPEARKLVSFTINMQQQMGILCEGQRVVPCENIKNSGYINLNTEVGKTGYKRRN